MKYITTGMLSIIILAACGPSEAQIATAIAETELARPTETSIPTIIPTKKPEPTEIPTYQAELVVKSDWVPSIANQEWMVEWGTNGSVSSVNFTIPPSGEGLRKIWLRTMTVKSGDTLTINVTGTPVGSLLTGSKYGTSRASCEIIVGDEVISSASMDSSISDQARTITCQVKID